MGISTFRQTGHHVCTRIHLINIWSDSSPISRSLYNLSMYNSDVSPAVLFLGDVSKDVSYNGTGTFTYVRENNI